jgi:glyoxylase-like metal-dependent hydrolase (beta-lactamase superfamily II)
MFELFKSGTGLTRREILASAAAMAATQLFGGVMPRPIRRRAEPPRLGVSQPTHYRFELGEFEVTTISDARAMIDGPWPIVGENRRPTEVERLMRDSLLPEKKFQPGFTPTVVNTGKELVLFDTGNGADGFVPRPFGGWLAGQLGPAGFAPETIDVVVLSHCHPDHIGGLMEAGKPLFPRARYVMGETEFAFWSSRDHLSTPPEGNQYKTARLFQTHVAPLAERYSLVKPDGEVVPGIRAVEAYGHTPGHLAFHVESRGKRLLLWGDCAHHEVASLARPEWHALFDMDKTRGAATRKRIFAMAAAERLPVVGYHASFPSLGFVQKQNEGYRWLPVSYQLNL